MKRELRFFKSELRASTDGAKISGYAAVFNQWSEDLGGFREMIQPGSFARAISSGQDVRCLFNHDSNFLMGRSISGTLRLSEDERGLAYDCDIPDTAAARDLRTLIARGDLTGCSFSFSVPEGGDSWYSDETGIIRRVLKNVDLFDVGPATYPAYPQTSVDARALWPDGEPDSITQNMLVLAHDGNDMDETVRRMRAHMRLAAGMKA